MIKSDFAASIPLFQRAIALDPNFAMAYARLATSYYDLSEDVRAAENSRKAYELRERVSERERFYIDTHYEIISPGILMQPARRMSYGRKPTPATKLRLPT